MQARMVSLNGQFVVNYGAALEPHRCSLFLKKTHLKGIFVSHHAVVTNSPPVARQELQPDLLCQIKAELLSPPPAGEASFLAENARVIY